MAKSAKTVVGLIDDFEGARETIDDLIGDGFSRDSIGIIAKEEKSRTAQGRERISDEQIKGVKVGVEAGAGVGALAGLLIGAGAFTVTGLGAVVAAGPIAAALAGAGLGAVTGGVYGAIRNLGVPENEAKFYAEGVQRGGVLVTVETDEAGAERAADILKSHGAVDIDQRSEKWKGSGREEAEPRERPPM